MQRQQRKSTLKRVVRIVVPIVILGLVVFFLAKNGRSEWQALTSHSFQLNLWWLVLAFAGFLLQELSYGLIWRSVLARLGYHLNFRACLRVYLASEFVRYIPGNVWHVLTRILWIGKYGVPRSVAFVSMAIELTTKLIAGALIFAASLLFWSDLHAFDQMLGGEIAFASIHIPVRDGIIGLGVIGILASLVVLHPRVLNLLLGFASRLLKREPVVLPLRYRDILLITLAWCGSWIIAGCAFFVLLLAIWPETPLTLLPVCIGIYALAWDVGFLSFITPSGLGFRELVIAAAFYPFPLLVSAGIPMVVAVLSRIVSTAAELLCVGLAYLGGGRLIRSLQQEEAQRSSPSSEPESVNDLLEAPKDDALPHSLELEKGVGS